MYIGSVPLVVAMAATENCCAPVAHFPHEAFHAMTPTLSASV